MCAGEIPTIRFGPLAVVLMAHVMVACGPAAPRTVSNVAGHIDEHAPIFVTAAIQKDEIVRSLRAAGLSIVDAPEASAYILRATVGVEQGTRQCGTLSNVRYALRQGGRDLIRIEAKGWTGTCEPNVFDDLARELRRALSPAADKEAPS